MIRAVRAAALIVLAGVLLAGCGPSQVIPHGAEKTIASFVMKRTGFRPTDVRCPSGISATVGMTFDCNFTGPDGSYVAYMRITQVQGERVLFHIRTRRLAAPAS
jgi:Domain of unknown function (DUF4333)